MTPSEREELWQAVAQSWDESSVRTADIAIATIAPIIERLVAERVAAYGELERAAVAWEANPDAPQEQGILDALAAIRSATR